MSRDRPSRSLCNSRYRRSMSCSSIEYQKPKRQATTETSISEENSSGREIDASRDCEAILNPPGMDLSGLTLTPAARIIMTPAPSLASINTTSYTATPSSHNDWDTSILTASRYACGVCREVFTELGTKNRHEGQCRRNHHYHSPLNYTQFEEMIQTLPESSPTSSVTPQVEPPVPATHTPTTTSVPSTPQQLTPSSHDERCTEQTMQRTPVAHTATTANNDVNHHQPPAPPITSQSLLHCTLTDWNTLLPLAAGANSSLPSDAISANLPEYEEVNAIPTRPYNNINGDDFSEIVDRIYNETVKWRKNLFQVPSGKSGKAFVKLLTEWLEHFNNNTPHQGIALKVFMIIPSLLLQKPSQTSKSKDHTKALTERLRLWGEGKFNDLLKECTIIQHKLTTSKKKTPEDISRIFSKLMFTGKIKAALRFLESNSENGVLQPSEDVLAQLQEKHPPAAEIQPNTLITGPLEQVSHAHFAQIDEQAVLKAAMRTKGSAGPSKFDSDQFRRILCSKHFKTEGKDLREQISMFARKIATSPIDPSCLGPYTACRLIPLNKNPGVRPIGVGEVLRRIVGKTIAWSLQEEIQHAAGPLQMSSGLKGGSEAAIHAMRKIFEDDTTDAVILVDASNAFNRLNRQAALHNIQYICPPLALTLINTYRNPARLFVVGGKEITSVEGTTQGDPLAMQFYALGTNPLLQCLKSAVSSVSQVWLADNAMGAGTLKDLKRWWDLIITEGSKLGYHVNEGKSWLILKKPEDTDLAQNIFRESKINITTSGKRHLGAALGSVDFKEEYIKEKVAKWCSEIKNLADIANSQPHAAYSAYTHGQQHKYRYFLRTISNIQEHLKPLDEAINNILIPALTGFQVNEADRELLSLPVKSGGLGIDLISDNANDEFEMSNMITAPLAAIIALQGDSLPDPEAEQEIRNMANKTKQEKTKEKILLVDESLSRDTKRNVDQARQPGASSWLTALPLEKFGFNMNKGEFRDAIALRYNKHINNLPSFCACGSKFDVTHAMNCKRGGFINARHDNIRDFEASLLSQVCNDVEKEPPLQQLNNEQLPRSANTAADARLDIRARGFWRRGQNAFFDVRVTNADCSSQTNTSIKSILKKHESEKKRSYNQRVMQVEQGTFTPLVFTTTGCMGPESIIFHKALAEKLSDKTGEKYNDAISFIRCKLSFMAIKSALLCLRGSRGPSKTIPLDGNDFGMYNTEINLSR